MDFLNLEWRFTQDDEYDREEEEEDDEVDELKQIKNVALLQSKWLIFDDMRGLTYTNANRT